MDTSSSNVRVPVLSSVFHHELGNPNVLTTFVRAHTWGQTKFVDATNEALQHSRCPIVLCSRQINNYTAEAIYSTMNNKSPAISKRKERKEEVEKTFLKYIRYQIAIWKRFIHSLYDTKNGWVQRRKVVERVNKLNIWYVQVCTVLICGFHLCATLHLVQERSIASVLVFDWPWPAPHSQLGPLLLRSHVLL